MLAMLGSQWIRAAAAVAAVFIAAFSPVLVAQDAEPEADAAGKATWQAAIAAMVHGPNTVPLKDQAQMALPAGYGFVPPKEGAAVARFAKVIIVGAAAAGGAVMKFFKGRNASQA